MNTKIIRVLLIDDHKVLREGLRLLLDSEADIEVVGEAGNAETALTLTAENNPDVVVMDLGLPGGGGLNAIKEIRARQYPVKIVVLSMHSKRSMITEALAAGSDGYVPKSSAHDNLLDAIRTVYAGHRFLDPTAATIVVDALLDRKDHDTRLDLLSDREQQVLKLTALGYTSREIGEQLSLSPKTIETYRQRVMEKLEFEHRSDLVRFALQSGLLEDIKPE